MAIILRGSVCSALLCIAANSSTADPPSSSGAEILFRLHAGKAVAKGVEYSVFLPKAYQSRGPKLPLLVLLHGAGGSARSMAPITALLGEAMNRGGIMPMVMATPSCERSLYVNRRDGAANWESFILDEWIPALRKEVNIQQDRKGLVLMGASMGGLGALRMAFKKPNEFLAVAAVSPAVEAGLTFKDVPPNRHIPTNSRAMLEDVFGKPIDADGFWTKNNPAAIATQNAAEVKASGLKVWIEVGAADDKGCLPGAAFLHSVLLEAGVKHDYAEAPGGKHDVRFFAPSLRRGLEFLTEQLRGAAEPPKK